MRILALSLFVLAVASAGEPLRIGQCAALDGPAAGLGQAMNAGLRAAIGEANAAGGIAGRPLELIAVDDGYEPDRTIAGTLALVEEHEVFCLAGYVGTPTMKVALPMISEMEIPLIGAFTGAGFLRQPVTRQMINIRASYDDETEALVERLTTDLGLTRIAVFHQDDSFGRVGLSGTTKALAKRNLEVVGTGTYARNTVAVKSGLAQILAAKPEAVIMVGAYQPLAAFVKEAKSAGLEVPFATISFVGTENLIAELGDSADGVIISQVVPSPQAEDLPVAVAYRAAMAAHVADASITYGSFEGYITGKVLVDGLTAAGADDRQALIDAIEGFANHDLGGLVATFSADDHQGLDQVHITVVADGAAVPTAKLSR